MKKLLAILITVLTLSTFCVATGCKTSDNIIYVDTNAFFAPFEYYDSEDNIVGVDVDIMNLVGEKLGKQVIFVNTEFGVIIDNVKKGTKYDCGAAGITITEERAKLVDFSNPYFTSQQYVIVKKGSMTKSGTTDDGIDYVLWEALAGLKIGVQLDTTGDIYVKDEIEATADDETYGYDGVLYGTGAKRVIFDNAQLAVDALLLVSETAVDAVVVDKLPAEYMVAKNDEIECFALYYDADTATEEKYAICVTKGNNELLDAINEVLAQLGEDGINLLVSKHLGLNG